MQATRSTAVPGAFVVPARRLGMMAYRSNLPNIAERRALRRVSIQATKIAGEADARYWSGQMAAVAERRDRESFMRIYDHFAPRLQRYLLGLGVGAGVAEELVQETMIRLWRKADLFDPRRASLSTWLFRIARNLYIDTVRREPSWRPEEEGLEQLQADASPRPLGSDAEAFAEQANLARAIQGLPAIQARLIRMSYFEAKSHSEIAEELGMALGTVKSSLRRAFGKLRDCLERPS